MNAPLRSVMRSAGEEKFPEFSRYRLANAFCQRRDSCPFVRASLLMWNNLGLQLSQHLDHPFHHLFREIQMGYETHCLWAERGSLDTVCGQFL